MRLNTGKICLFSLAALVLFATSTLAASHHQLNGTWILDPTRSEFAGEPAIQTGTVTINDRQHNIYISRNFDFDGQKQTYEYSFSTDGRESATIHQGENFKSKAKWDGDVLKVTTEHNGSTIVERYSLEPDGSLMLVVERPEHRVITLFFHRP